MARHRSGPTTAPLDLAALARTDAPATTPMRRVAAPAAPVPTPRTPAPTAASPARTGAHAAHRAAPGRTPILASTRTAGVLALAGALAGAGLASTATSTAVVASPTPTTTGDLQVSELANASRTARASSSATPGADGGSSSGSSSTSSGSRATPAPSGRAAAPDDGGRTLWNADFAADGLENFKRTPWNTVGGRTPKVSDGALSVSIPGGGKRAEVEPDFKNLEEGDEYYFGFSVRLADDFPANGDQWQVITQWKNQGTGTPPLEVKVQDGHFVLDGDGGSFSEVIGDARPGQWTHLALRVAFSSSDGSVSAWQDGASTLSDFRPASGTLYSGKSSYLKIGLYRNSSISADGALQFGSYAIGTSRGSVSRDLSRAR